MAKPMRPLARSWRSLGQMLMPALFCIAILNFPHHTSLMGNSHKNSFKDIEDQYDEEECTAAAALKVIHEKKEHTMKV
jgi:hypothetical protein